MGVAVVETLVASGYDVMGCDKNMEAVKQMEHIATDVMQLDVMNEDAMQYIGLNNFDVVIVAIGESLEASIMATMYAKEKGVKTVIAKAMVLLRRNFLKKLVLIRYLCLKEIVVRDWL